MRNQSPGAPDYLSDAVQLMKHNVSERLFVEEIADYLKLSTRQLERAFKRHFNTSPSQYYLRVRLNTARNLLRHSSAPVRAIAIETVSSRCSISASVISIISRYAPPRSAAAERRCRGAPARWAEQTALREAFMARRSGGRQARKAQRSAPLADAIKPVHPGESGGQFKPLTQADVAAITDNIFRLLEEVGFADATPHCIDTCTRAGAGAGRRRSLADAARPGRAGHGASDAQPRAARAGSPARP